MSKKIVIIDYSLGNMFSVQQALSFCGAEATISHSPSEILAADALILPGVGAFSEAMNYLRGNGLDVAIKESVGKGKPFLGVCLGLQLLFDTSEEFGSTRGLGLIKGEIRKFTSVDPQEKLHVPQVGWNTISAPPGKDWKGTILEGVSAGEYMYFVHSYYAVPSVKEDVMAMTTYGGTAYCSAVLKNNIVATQFHPEKSGEKGITIYKNWLSKI
jgi:imidazole glycerol-phosphate synthase subunit HisH